MTALKEMPTIDMIALAVAVYQYQSNEYIKEDTWDAGVVNKKYSNKNIIRANLGFDHYSSQPHPPIINVLQEHYNIANDIKEYTKKLLMKMISQSPDSYDYEVQLYKRLNQPTATSNDVGFIASSPMYYYNNKRRDEIKSRLDEGKSHHVGEINGKVELQDFEVTRNQWSNNYQGYVVMGLCNDNLFIFFTDKNVSHIKIGDKINLKGKVKDHVLEKDKYPMTKLKYVKIEGVIDETPSTTRSDSYSDLF